MTGERGKHKEKNEDTVAFEFSVLVHESSPVEKIAPNLCGMKASFEEYLKKNYGYSIMRDNNLQNLCFGLGLETRVEQKPQKLKLNNLANVNINFPLLNYLEGPQSSNHSRHNFFLFHLIHNHLNNFLPENIEIRHFKQY